MEAEQQEMWEEKKDSTITTEELDVEIALLRELDVEKKATKKVSELASVNYTTQQTKVMRMMEQAGKEEYVVTGVGRVKVKEMLSVQTPKSPADKEAFFNWVKENMGMDSYYHYMSVNSRTLNALYGEKVEEYAAEGNVLEIDGIAAPTSFAKMSFTKA